ncbi:enoyl-CoA hydratase [Metarhizium anisopliae]
MAYGIFTTTQSGAVLTASIDNAPINICDWKFMSDFDDLLSTITSSRDVKVLVVKSANPDFFVAHIDLLPRAESTLPEMHPEYPTLGFFSGLMYKLTNLPLVTIALVEGRARAAGCDFTMAFDIRFGVRGRTRLSHIEACIGIYAAGGGAMRWTQQMGKARALEYLYSGRDIEAEEAERYGLINRAFNTSAEMYEFVDAYVGRVAKFELTGLAMTKKRVNDATRASSLEVFEKDSQVFMELLSLPKTTQLVGEIWALVQGATDCDEERTLPDALMALPSYN